MKISKCLRSYRAHGWIRERNDAQEIADQYPDMDPRFYLPQWDLILE